MRSGLAEILGNERWQLTADDIILTIGGSNALFYCAYSMCNKGDQILLPKPCFPLLDAICKFLGVQPVMYFTVFTFRYEMNEKDWQPNFEDIEEKLATHKKIRFIMINSPNNPLGSILDEDSIRRLIKSNNPIRFIVCEVHNNLPILADEIYEYMTFPGVPFRFLVDYVTTVPILRYF